MKKLLWGMNILLLAAMLMVNFTGCSSKPEKKEQSAGADTQGKKVELLWIPWASSANAPMPEDGSFVAQEINKMFNVELKVQPTFHSDMQKMGMMYASGIIPNYQPVGTGNFINFMDQGLYRDIPMDMFKKYAPELYRRVTAAVDLNEVSAMRNGKLYGIPHVSNPPQAMSVVRTDWLQKVGAKVPTTIEEFENVAKLFTENDPDGNGKKDTYMLAWGPGWGKNFDFISAAFKLTSDFTVGADGKIELENPNYKNYLKYIQQLYKKGYIYPDLTQTKADNVKNLFGSGVVGYTADTITWFMPKYRPTAYYAQTFTKNPNAKTEYVAPLKAIDGKPSAFLELEAFNVYGCIGKNTTDEQLIRILQILEKQMSDLTFHNLIWRGVEGKHFTVNEDGMAIAAKEYESLEAQAKEGIKFFFINIRQGKETTLSYGREAEVQNDFQARNYQQPIKRMFPLEMVTEIGKDYSADINKVKEEFFIKALSGTLNIDAEWDNYIDKLKKAGQEKLIAELNKKLAEGKK